jgi:RNA polymerase sigma-70 factor, ECF subfamily
MPAEQVQQIQAAQQGDPEAFRAIIADHQRCVLRTAYRLLGNTDQAQDAAQEVFLRVYKYLHRFDCRRDFSPWLYGVTLNVCRTLRQRQRSQRWISLEAIPPEKTMEWVAKLPDPQARTLDAEKRQWVERALQLLSPKEREALVLRDLEGLNTRLVAEILGSSETTVRVQISQARLKVKKHLEAMVRRDR